MSDKNWEEAPRYVPGPGMPVLPPQLQQDSPKTVDEVARELKKLPFFMTDAGDLDNDDEESREQIEALKALAYEGDPEVVAKNFKAQGNEQYMMKRYKDAIVFYTKAINLEGLGEKGENPAEGKAIKQACLGNRAACNLSLKNYRRCINDCKTILAQFDPKHEKSIFRAGKAYAAIDKPEEGIELLEYGISVVPESKSIPELLASLKERYEKKLELERKKHEAEQLKQTKKQNLEAAIAGHKFTLLKSVHASDDDDTSAFPPDVRIHLEDDLNPASALIVPVLFLYPVDMQSDIIQQTDVTTTVISEYLYQLFGGELPQWINEENGNTEDYSNIKTLEVYAQTDSGGLVKVGKSSTLEKVFSLQKPVVPVIDGIPRLYVVPKSKSKEWLSKWNKDLARYRLYGE